MNGKEINEEVLTPDEVLNPGEFKPAPTNEDTSEHYVKPFPYGRATESDTFRDITQRIIEKHREAPEAARCIDGRQ